VKTAGAGTARAVTPEIRPVTGADLEQIYAVWSRGGVQFGVRSAKTPKAGMRARILRQN